MLNYFTAREHNLIPKASLFLYCVLISVVTTFVCRSTVHSNVIPPNTQQNLTSYEHRKIMEQASTNFRAMDSCSGNPSKVSRPPPRVPTCM